MHTVLTDNAHPVVYGKVQVILEVVTNSQFLLEDGKRGGLEVTEAGGEDAGAIDGGFVKVGSAAKNHEMVYVCRVVS